MIVLREVTKRFGARVAVDRVSFEVPAGRVTGLLGPNGAGKATTLDLICGLSQPTEGQVLLGGSSSATPSSGRAVGFSPVIGPGDSARDGREYLVRAARSTGVSACRVEDVVELAGLGRAAADRVGDYCRGTRRRLRIAAALLSDARVLVLREPTEGLDPEGVAWARGLFRTLAAQGRVVLVTTHRLNEVTDLTEHVIVMRRGRVIADMSTADVIARSSDGPVRIRTPQAGLLADRLISDGFHVDRPSADELRVRGGTVEEVGELAHRFGVLVHELTMELASFERAYAELATAGPDA
ncbi:ABC transporter ATP-binding protein [Micromonospora sp. CA-240977]|uniref:ABC transporter ATP-binding protein n=1 Tax=Micromonospora sp. CA-240977 TaxID=3239957 RepID=UPI003D8C7258